MNMKFAKTAATIIVALSAMVSAETLTGRDIVQKVHDRPDGDTRSSEFSMTLINKSGAKRERKITSFAMDVGKDTKQIMFFRYPNDVKGTGFLTVDYDDINKDDDKWLYLPAMKKTRRISGKSSKTDYFMGSDFTYDDVGQRNIDEDTHKLLREEKVDGIDCWVVESVPENFLDSQGLPDCRQGGILRQARQTAPLAESRKRGSGGRLLVYRQDEHGKRADQPQDAS